MSSLKHKEKLKYLPNRSEEQHNGISFRNTAENSLIFNIFAIHGSSFIRSQYYFILILLKRFSKGYSRKQMPTRSSGAQQNFQELLLSLYGILINAYFYVHTTGLTIPSFLYFITLLLSNGEHYG